MRRAARHDGRCHRDLDPRHHFCLVLRLGVLRRLCRASPARAIAVWLLALRRSAGRCPVEPPAAASADALPHLSEGYAFWPPWPAYERRGGHRDGGLGSLVVGRHVVVARGCRRYGLGGAQPEGPPARDRRPRPQLKLAPSGATEPKSSSPSSRRDDGGMTVTILRSNLDDFFYVNLSQWIAEHGLIRCVTPSTETSCFRCRLAPDRVVRRRAAPSPGSCTSCPRRSSTS